jgi:hypothetical protein
LRHQAATASTHESLRKLPMEMAPQKAPQTTMTGHLLASEVLAWRLLSRCPAASAINCL